MKDDEIRWGILGCGDVTEVKSGPAFDRIEGSRRVAVMRRDGEKAHDYAQRHGVPRWYSDADDLIADPQVNAIYIATPPDSHAEYTLRAARAGKPVYVEKPMARTHDECERMIDACGDAGVPLFVAYYRRRLPTFLKARELIEDGAIGDVRFAGVTLVGPPAPDSLDGGELPWRVLPEISGGGLFFDVGSHQLDLLDFLLGPIESARGHAVNQAGWYPAEDAVSASFAFESGAIGNGIWCFTLSPGSTIDRTDIVGAQGRITFSTFGLDQPLTLVRENGQSEEFLLPPPTHVQEPLIQTIVDALNGRGTCPSTGVSAARTSKVMDSVVASRT
jgi:predicted dehydrogenase